MSNAKTTTGILIRRGNGETPGPETFTTIGELLTLTPPGFSRNKIETTTHNDGAESYVLGILRQKDPTFRINYVGSDATHQSILDDILGNDKNNWEIVFPSGTVIAGPFYVQRFEFVDMPPDAAQQVDVALTPSGPLVLSNP